MSTLTEFYPGTTRKINGGPARSAQTPGHGGGDSGVTLPQRMWQQVEEKSGWAEHPREYTVRGEVLNFYTIGALAKALGRKPVTMRLWEAQKILPATPWRAPYEAAPARFRLYPADVIIGIAVIAEQEGVLTPGSPLERTKFRARVAALFDQSKIAYSKKAA